MRLIDADALMVAMYHRAFETDNDTMWLSGCWVRYRAIEQVIREQPSADAVNVVRCKDCKHRYVEGENVRYNVCGLNHNKLQSDDWYCADGELMK